MKTFSHPSSAGHGPRFSIQRGNVRPNFEVPERALVLEAALHRMGLPPTTALPASRDQMGAVHTGDYLDFLANAVAEWDALPDKGAEVVANIHPVPEMAANGARTGNHIIAKVGWYTMDLACPIGPGSWEAIKGAAGCALAAADEAAQGRSAYALCRPPGHHAYAARAGGHCYVNNAALAAEALRYAGAKRVATLDIDSHHGNGTQGIFWERGDVLTISIHGHPDFYYPWFVGRADEGGAGAGEGCNINLPLAHLTGDEGWLGALDHGLTAIRAFGADALVVPLGFDASKDEPLRALSVTEDGFARAGERIAALNIPTAITQEGGYNVEVIGTLLERFLGAWGR